MWLFFRLPLSRPYDGSMQALGSRLGISVVQTGIAFAAQFLACVVTTAFTLNRIPWGQLPAFASKPLFLAVVITMALLSLLLWSFILTVGLFISRRLKSGAKDA